MVFMLILCYRKWLPTSKNSFIFSCSIFMVSICTEPLRIIWNAFSICVAKSGVLCGQLREWVWVCVVCVVCGVVQCVCVCWGRQAVFMWLSYFLSYSFWMAFLISFIYLFLCAIGFTFWNFWSILWKHLYLHVA